MGSVEPFRFAEPLDLEIRFKRIEAAQAASRGLRRVSASISGVRWHLDALSDYF